MTQFIGIISIVNCMGAFHGIILALIIGKAKRGNRDANHILSTLIFVFSIGMAGSAYFASEFYKVFPHFLLVFPPFIFTYGPLLYLYIKTLTSRNFRLTKKHLLHFIPFALNSLYFIPFHLRSGAEKITMIEEFLKHPTPVSYIVLMVRIAHAFIYIFFCIRLLQVHARKIKDSFSTVEKVNLSWMRHLLFLFIFVWLVVFMLYYLIPHSPDKEKLNFTIIYFLVSLSIFTIGYRGLSQPEIFASFPDGPQFTESGRRPQPKMPPNRLKRLETAKKVTFLAHFYSILIKRPKKRKYEKSGLSPENAGVLQNQLLQFMDAEKPYLEPGLTLPELAKALNVQCNHLSQVINDNLQQNFFKFINSYRVEEAKKRITQHETKNDKLIKIAFDVGFNSNATFNRVFKELTGQSPSQFRNTVFH